MGDSVTNPRSESVAARTVEATKASAGTTGDAEAAYNAAYHAASAAYSTAYRYMMHSARVEAKGAAAAAAKFPNNNAANVEKGVIEDVVNARLPAIQATYDAAIKAANQAYEDAATAKSTPTSPTDHPWVTDRSFIDSPAVKRLDAKIARDEQVVKTSTDKAQVRRASARLKTYDAQRGALAQQHIANPAATQAAAPARGGAVKPEKPAYQLTPKQYHKQENDRRYREGGKEFTRKNIDELYPLKTNSHYHWAAIEQHVRGEGPQGRGTLLKTVFNSLTEQQQRALLHDYPTIEAHKQYAIANALARQSGKTDAYTEINKQNRRSAGATKAAATRAANKATKAVTAAPTPAPAPTTPQPPFPQPWTGHPMENPIYKAITGSGGKREPFVVQGKEGQPLTLVPDIRNSPRGDLVTFSIRDAAGKEVAASRQMTRFEFEQAAMRMTPAPVGAPRYTPPKPKALSTLDTARFATSWSKTQAEAVAEYAKTAMPYLRNVRVVARTSTGSKTPRYTITGRDHEKGVAVSASTWRDLASHHELRGVMPNGF